MTRRWTVLCGAFAVVLGASLWVSAEPKSTGGVKAFKPVQTTEHLMHGQKKLMGDIKSAIGEKDWESGEVCAWMLAECANVNHYQKDDAAYHGFAATMSSQCVELAGLIKKKDEKGAKDLVNAIGKTCGACHDQFEKK
ncbi:MAG: hypothetical protein AABZ08_08595 [Planctomycetota bacterium]